MRARYAEAVEAYTAMRTAAEAAGDVAAQAWAWNGLSKAQERQGDYRAVLESAGQAERLGASAGEAGREARAAALQPKGVALYRLGDAAGVLALGEQALALSAELGDALAARRVQAWSLNLLGAAHMMLGHSEQAVHYYEQALALYRALGDRWGVGRVLNNLSVTAESCGDYAAAAARYQEALTIAREIGDRDGEMVYLSNLGGARVGQGDYAAAEAGLRQVIEMVGAASWWLLSETYRFLAEACLGQGKTAEALDAARRALALGQETGNQEHIGGAWRTLGNCGARMADFRLDVPNLQSPIVRLSAHDKVSNPQSCYAESLRIFTEIGMEAERAYTLRDWARYELAGGDRDKGAAMWGEARAIFEGLDMPLEVARMEAERKL